MHKNDHKFCPFYAFYNISPHDFCSPLRVSAARSLFFEKRLSFSLARQGCNALVLLYPGNSTRVFAGRDKQGGGSRRLCKGAASFLMELKAQIYNKYARLG